MIVQPAIADAIVTGKATQILRRIRPAIADDMTPPHEPEDRIAIERYLTDAEVREAGVDVLLAVQEGRLTRPAQHVCFVVTTSVKRVRLGALHFADIARMGYTSEGFHREQIRAHDGLWRHRMRTRGLDPDTASAVSERWAERHANANAWMVSFRLDREASPRFLAARPELGYVVSEFDPRGRRIALVGEPEAVDEATQERLAAAGRTRDAERRAERVAELERLPLVERVRRLERARGSVDVSGDLRAISRRVLGALRRAS